MADEEDPWGFGDDDAAAEPAAATPAQATPAAAASAVASAAGGSVAAQSLVASVTGSIAGDLASTGGAQEESVAAPPPPPEDDGYRKPVQLYRHWVRPKFLQYKYMYNYRTNYYDDVIDYLDKKQVGVTREIPRPQTWAERVLRTNYCRYSDNNVYTPSKHFLIMKSFLD